MIRGTRRKHDNTFMDAGSGPVTTGTAPHLGPPVQIAFGVSDLRRAVSHWSDRLGAGPFFVIEHIPLQNVRYRGASGEFDHSSAYGQWGGLMVELVRDHTRGPSPVSDILGKEGTGLHHAAFFVEDLTAGIAKLRDFGWPEALRAETSNGMAFAFCDASADLGYMVELYEPAESLLAFYSMVAQAAQGWDGSEPFRLIR